MTRLLAAALLLGLSTAPAFACMWNKSAATDTKPSTVASQPSGDHTTTPPPVTPSTQKAS